jgi:hypothetical protein
MVLDAIGAGTETAGTCPMAPLVLYAHDEKDCVREAVESALGQDSSPREPLRARKVIDPR